MMNEPCRELRIASIVVHGLALMAHVFLFRLFSITARMYQRRSPFAALVEKWLAFFASFAVLALVDTFLFICNFVDYQPEHLPVYNWISFKDYFARQKAVFICLLAAYSSAERFALYMNFKYFFKQKTSRIVKDHVNCFMFASVFSLPALLHVPNAVEGNRYSGQLIIVKFPVLIFRQIYSILVLICTFLCVLLQLAVTGPGGRKLIEDCLMKNSEAEGAESGSSKKSKELDQMEFLRGLNNMLSIFLIAAIFILVTTFILITLQTIALMDLKMGVASLVHTTDILGGTVCTVGDMISHLTSYIYCVVTVFYAGAMLWASRFFRRKLVLPSKRCSCRARACCARHSLQLDLSVTDSAEMDQL